MSSGRSASSLQRWPKLFEPTSLHEEQEALDDRRLHRLIRVRAHAAVKRLIDACCSLGKPSREQHELCLMRRGVPRLRRQLEFLSKTGVALQVPLALDLFHRA